MTRPLLLLVSLLFIQQLAFSQIKGGKYLSQKFSPDTVKNVINDLTKELSIKHPGFFRYTSKQDFTRYIDSVKSTINESLTEIQSYVKLKAIMSKIGCLHTEIGLRKEHTDYLNQQPNLFPFQVYYDGVKAFVVNNYSTNSSIAQGDELLSINGQDIQHIIHQIVQLVPSDGFNQTMKHRAVYYQFPIWYRLIDQTGNFKVVVKQKSGNATYQVKGARYDEIVRDGFLKELTRAKQLEFRVENNIGFLTIHTFSNSDIKKSGQNFKDFIDNTFERLAKEKIKNLVVDLRDNTGGSDGNAVYFTKYFFEKPFRYWDRIEVTEASARDVKGVALKMFYRTPIQKDSIWLWQKAKLVRDFDYYEEQEPVSKSYSGNTYVLINGFTMSSSADVAAILSHNKKATFIGQETGGGYQGNTSGIMPTAKVEPFGFTITVPLQKYVNYVDTTKNFGKGTMPDHLVHVTISDILKGIDKELETAINLINSKSN